VGIRTRVLPDALISGKPCLATLQLLGRIPGIARAGIGGIADNQELPTDVTHIYVLILFPTVWDLRTGHEPEGQGILCLPL